MTTARPPTSLLRFDGAVSREPAIEAWWAARPPELAAIARGWFERMRACGGDVRELLHDGAPTACVGDAGFAYVNVFSRHVNVGFFRGASLPDPSRILLGDGRFMRHVKLRPDLPTPTAALEALVAAAYADMAARVRAELPR